MAVVTVLYTLEHQPGAKGNNLVEKEMDKLLTMLFLHAIKL